MRKRVLALVAIALWSMPSITAVQAETLDPAKAEVPLPALSGWQASLVYQSDVGIWTNGDLQVYPKYGCPEVFGLDDRGRCTILVSYSGKWTPFQTVEDGEWLGALSMVDLDRGRDGPEIYTGGKKGNLYQIIAHREGGFDTRVIARFPAQEIHTIVGGDLLPSREGNELLVFSRDGVVWDVRSTENGVFETPVLDELGGRVRQGLILPAPAGASPWIVAACRFGKILLLRMTEHDLEQRAVTEEPMGFGRLALRKSAPGEQTVLYATRDDGVILRLAGTPESGFQREIIYAGPQGPRGIAAGRFDADPEVETVAVFGYSKKIQLLSRRPGQPWKVETLFEDIEKGHWLHALEIDGRNSTDELIGSGYGGRIVALARPPGYGLDAPTSPAETEPAPVVSPPRVAVHARPPVLSNLHPLSYRGGFEIKTAIYETLVRRDANGGLAPGLAESWVVADDGRSVTFRLREGATWHDDSPVDAASVRTHMLRWVGLPEHSWLRSSDRIIGIDALDPKHLRVRLDRSCALIPDLCAINPAAVRAPSALSRDGEFVSPVGSGPLRFVAATGDQLLRLAVLGDPGSIELRVVDDGDDALRLLRAGQLDVVCDGWYRLVPRAELGAIRADPTLQVASYPGSAVRYISFRMDGATADRAVRAAVRSAVDRGALIRRVERGAADPCWSWAAPSVAEWPRGSDESIPSPGSVKLPKPLRLRSQPGDDVYEALAAQLRAAGLDAELVADDDPTWDLRIESTWGVPYDPYISLTARFLPATTTSASTVTPVGVPPEVAARVAAAAQEPRPDRMPEHYREVQRAIDQTVAIVPLYVPHRLAVARRGVSVPPLDHDLYRVDYASIRNQEIGTPTTADAQPSATGG